MGQGISWQRTWKRLRQPTLSSPQSLLLMLTFRNPGPLRPEPKSGPRKTYPQWRSIKLGNAEIIDIHKWLHGRHPQLLRGLTDVIVKPVSVILERPQWSGGLLEDWKKAATPIPHTRRARRRIWGITGWPASPWSLGKWWSNKSWKPFQGIWRTGRWLGVVSMDL